ncbi:MAG: hypothetical protein LAT67_14870, partial [Balneolales bacterium]|nr:hypothetical protein [Balneolales bacterium]
RTEGQRGDVRDQKSEISGQNSVVELRNRLPYHNPAPRGRHIRSMGWMAAAKPGLEPRVKETKNKLPEPGWFRNLKIYRGGN